MLKAGVVLSYCLTQGLQIIGTSQPLTSGEEQDLLGPLLGYQDAMDEVLVAVEQVVIPKQQAIELLPRMPELLDMQVSFMHYI